MSEEFNWLDYAEPEESAPDPPQRSGRRRFLPRLPSLPRLPRLPGRPIMPGLPRLRMPALLRRRRAEATLEQPSATDLLGGHDERPLDELDDRLLSLRERSVASAQPSAESRRALYDVDDVLVTPEILEKPGGVISAVALSKAQQQQIELLRDIVGGSPQANEPSGRGLLPKAQVFSLTAVPRLIGTGLLLLLVSLPFVSSDFSEGELPPSDFDEGRRGAATVYNLLDNLTQDDTVLIGFEYGPTAAGELDPLADLLIRHVVAQGAKPLIVSSNPIAIAHAQNIIREINRSVASAGIGLERGRDYHILRYLPGGSLGLRELSENFADVVRVSAKGELTGLEFDSLSEMALIVLIAEYADDMRNWAEQVMSEADGARLLAATGYAAAPIAQVYADAMDEIVGLLVGYRDVYTYGEKLALNFGELPQAQPEVAPASPETATVPPVEATGEQAAQAERARATAQPPPTSTPMPSATSLPTTTPLPTVTSPPTATHLPTATATLETIRIVEVISPQQVRIRRGPTTADDILQLARAGDSFEVTGANGDESWYRIALSNGLDGWIAAFLVEERMVTAAEFRSGQASASANLADERVILWLESIVSLGKTRPRFYQSDSPAPSDELEYIWMRDRSQEVPRLRAMTFGTLAAILLIAVGNVFYALAALRRRGREAQSE
ncbi:MAG: SH3 domain-containing protein [Chloroflexota bacterium]|nr:SH3 domain-containing protein [Chloroflexota bacterium]